jgi:hypothetical protein
MTQLSASDTQQAQQTIWLSKEFIFLNNGAGAHQRCQPERSQTQIQPGAQNKWE